MQGCTHLMTALTLACVHNFRLLAPKAHRRQQPCVQSSTSEDGASYRWRNNLSGEQHPEMCAAPFLGQSSLLKHAQHVMALVSKPMTPLSSLAHCRGTLSRHSGFSCHCFLFL